ncbi:MAG: DUF1501 domain-containing protein [Planctomycetaceae bacterium]
MTDSFFQQFVLSPNKRMNHEGNRQEPDLSPRVPSADLQQMELELLDKRNRRHLEPRAADAALDACVRSFETAFGVQREAPEAFDLSRETEATVKLYGLERGATQGFGWPSVVTEIQKNAGTPHKFCPLYEVVIEALTDAVRLLPLR